MIHVVMYSGGIGSWATAARVKERMAPGDRLVLLFADVKGASAADNPHIGEDEDTYRFIDQTAAQLEAELVRVADGRTIWEVFRDKRFLGNARLANCSHLLKQAPARKWLEENTTPDDSAVYVGIDWTETHRVPAIEKAYLPWRCSAPMAEAPYVSKADMVDALRAEGIEPPRAYALGFPHNNCGGGCVRAGQAQFRKLLQVMPARYAEWERQEAALREHLGKDVAILRDRRGGSSRPLTLTEFRDANTDDEDTLDFGGCGCFVTFDSDINHAVPTKEEVQ